jgi:hypothetical protein
VGKNSVIYMGLNLGPNKTDEICVKMKVTGTMHCGFTVYTHILQIQMFTKMTAEYGINHKETEYYAKYTELLKFNIL